LDTVCLLLWRPQVSNEVGNVYTRGVAVDGSGNVFVADTNNNRLQKFTSTGTFLTTWGSSGTGDGQFTNPFGVATDSSGNVFVADANNNRIQKFDANGTFLTMWGSAIPQDVATDGSGNVYVADADSNNIQKFACP
jgi:DNA-binding beta-propeller fold protein YncE